MNYPIANYPIAKYPIAKHLSVVLLMLLFSITSHPLMAQEIQPEPESSPQQENEALEESSAMTPERMKTIISEITEEVKEEGNVLSFYYLEAPLLLISDKNANRMRIVAPVVAANSLTEEQVLATLVSNYHLALDARYAIGDGYLYSVFIHPLKELTDEQLVSAVRQVATLRNTFGSSYTSGELTFGVESEEEKVEI